MGKAAQALGGQSQSQVLNFAKGGKVGFEKSKKDKEPKGMKEGSKKEEAFDAKQMKCGGKVKK